MPFLLLDDATDEATRRLTQFGQNLLQPPQPPAQTQQTDSLQDITGRLQDFGSQQLQTLQQLNQPPFPTTAGQPPPIPGVTLPQPPPELVQLNQPPFAGAAPGAPPAVQPLQVLPAGGGLQDITQRLQDHGSQVLQAAQQQLQQLPQVQPIAPISGPPAPGQPQAGGDLQDYARQVANKYGIDPDIFVRQIQQESGFNPGARSPAGATGIAQFMPDTARGMGIDPSDPYAALDAAARLDAQNLSKYGGDYSKALAAYNAGGGNVDKYGGVPPFSETQNYVSTILGGAKQAVQGAVQGVQQAGQQVLGQISQFGDKQLSAAEAYTACGPAAAVRFAQMFGRQPTLREAVDLASSVGWTAAQGMAGLGSESALFDKMGIPHREVGADWTALAREAQSGNPVTISTPGHYFTADNYDPSSGAFHVGSSGTDLRGGGEWMTPAQMEARMGQLQGGLAVDNPQVPGDSPLSVGAMAANPLMPSNLVSRGMQILGQAVQPETRQALGRALQQAPAPSDRDISLISGLPELPGLAGVARFGTQALGGLLAQPSALDAVGTIDRVNRKMLDDPSSITDADRADLQQAQMIVGGLTGAPESGTTRMYHGTGADFPRVSPEAVTANEANLFGPGYYLTSDPRVAGGVVSGERVAPATNVEDAIAQFRATGMPGGGVEPGDILRTGYAQAAGNWQDRYAVIQKLARGLDEDRAELQSMMSGPLSKIQGLAEYGIPRAQQRIADAEARIAELAGTTGPNVRAVDVPNNVKLLDAEAPVSPQDQASIFEAAGQNAKADLIRERLAAGKPVADYRSGEALWGYIRGTVAGGDSAEANRILAQAGFDGIAYSGGKRIPMTDATGKDIQHNVQVIFPESLDKIRNAVSGTMGGAAQAGYTAGLGGAAAGLAGAGALLGGGLADVRDKAQAVADSLSKGFTAGARVPTELTENPLMPSNILAGAARSFGYQPALQSAMDKLRSGQELTPEENTAFGDAVRMLAMGVEQPQAGATGAAAAAAERAGPGLWNTIGRSIQAGRIGALAGGIPTLGHIALNTPVQTGLKLASDIPASVLSGHPEATAAELYGMLQGLRSWGLNASQTVREAGPLARSMGATSVFSGPGALETGLTGLVKAHPLLQDVARQMATHMDLWKNAAQGATDAGLTRFSPAWRQEVQRLVSDPTATMTASAQAAGNTAALSGPMGTTGQAIADLLQKSPIAKFFAPIYNIGYQVATRGVEMTPLGWAGTLADVARAGVGQGPYARVEPQVAQSLLGRLDAAQQAYSQATRAGDVAKAYDRLNAARQAVEDARAALPPVQGFAGRGAAGAVTPLAERVRRNLIGLALMYEGYNQAAVGNITGEGPADPQEQAVLRQTGWQPDSARLGANADGTGGRYFDLHLLGPVGWPLVAGANAYEATHGPGGAGLKPTQTPQGEQAPSALDQLGDFVAREGRYFNNETFLRSVGSALNLIGSSAQQGQVPAREAASLLESMIPQGALLANLGSATDPYQRQVSNATPQDILQQSIESRLPGARENLMPRLTATGQMQPNPQQGLGILLPRSSVITDDPILRQMQTLGITPIGAPKTVAFGPLNDVHLTPAEQHTWEQYRGAQLQKTATTLINSSAYQKMSDVNQRNALAKVASLAASSADKLVLKDIGTQAAHARMVPTGKAAPVYSYAPGGPISDLSGAPVGVGIGR